MAYINSNYQPNELGREILERANEHLNSVAYKSTARWLFYRLLQDGYYTKKSDYRNKFMKLLSNVRHNCYGGWAPDTLVDDTRAAIIKTGVYKTTDDWVEDFSNGGFVVNFDHFYSQTFYVEIWFEAAAMIRQFQYYIKGVNLRPFQGKPSIPYKYEIAKSLDAAWQRYRKRIVILYFGDYDPVGLEIQRTAEEDIKGWCRLCNGNLEIVRCGLNAGDGERFGMPENIKKPGSYQWEALDDAHARELITTSVDKVVDKGIVEHAAATGKKAAKIFDKYVSGFSDYIASGEYGD